MSVPGLFIKKCYLQNTYVEICSDLWSTVNYPSSFVWTKFSDKNMVWLHINLNYLATLPNKKLILRGETIYYTLIMDTPSIFPNETRKIVKLQSQTFEAYKDDDCWDCDRTFNFFLESENEVIEFNNFRLGFTE